MILTGVKKPIDWEVNHLLGKPTLGEHFLQPISMRMAADIFYLQEMEKLFTSIGGGLNNITHWTKRALAFIKTRTYPKHLSGDAPAIRELARRYRVNQQKIVDALEDHESICMNIGLRLGNGTVGYESIGDYNFEWLGN